MKLAKSIASLVAALCACAITSADAQQVTNAVTLNILFVPQGHSSAVDGTNVFYAPEKTSSYNAARFLHEIGLALHAENGANLTRTAKLVLLTGGKQAPLFAVVDETNFYALTNVMQLVMPLETTIMSGTQNGGTGLAFPTIKSVTMAQLVYNDVSILGGDGLQFILQGIESSSTTDTVPAGETGAYSETVRGIVSSLAGQVSQSNALFYATGTMTFSGKAKLILH